VTSSTIEVEPGVRLHVVDDGGPVAGGPPVVLLAGLGLDHESWAGAAAALSRCHRVVRIDLRGTGRSDAPTDGYSLDRLARDVMAVLDHLDLSEVVLAGHSFGAQIGLLVAATAPSRLSRFAMVCSNGVRASRSDEFPFGLQADRVERALVRAELENREEGRRQNVRAGFPAAADPDPDWVERLVECQLRMPFWAAVACFRTYLRADLTAELAGLKMPVLQILGAYDPVTSVEGGAWVQERMADGRLVVLDGCGHYPMFEAPDRFVALLADFAAGGDGP
jgi:pimeloyl-ACP methyl ester carboxylesterase